MSKIILFAPSDVESFGKIDVKHIDADYIPLGIAYIANFVRNKGHDVDLIHLREYGDWKSKVCEVLREKKPNFVGITTVTPLIKEAKKIASLVKETDKSIKVVVGGPHASALPEETLKYPDIDIIAVGEGEETVLELLNGKKLNEIKGILYKVGKKICKNPLRPLIKDLDKLPFPAYDLLPVHKYGTPFLGKGLMIMSGRGCPYQCIFCSSKTVHRGIVRLRSAKNVVDEIEHIINKYEIKNFTFVDDTFTIDSKRVMKICDEIIRRKLKIKWSCDTRVDSVSLEILQKMKKVGCKMIKFGIETGDSKIMKIIKKGITLEQVKKAVKMAKDVGIETTGFFMFGHPYDTKETIMKTIKFSQNLGLDYAQFSVVIPYPGTELVEMASKEKGLKLLNSDFQNFKRYGKPIIELPTVSKEELENYHSLAYRGFYFRPSYMIRRFFKTNPKAWMGLFKNALSLLGFIKKSKTEKTK